MTDEKSQDAADHSEESAVTDSTDAPAPVEAAAATGGAAASSGGGRGLVIAVLALLVLIAVALSGYAFYLSYQLQASQAETATRQQTLADDLAEISSEQRQTRDELARLEQARESTQAALDRLVERERMDNFDWAMAEVEYLTIIALQRLNLAQDVDTALAALEAAARRVKDIDNPALIPVREQLTKDINALRAVPETDIEGMALYLADLVDRAEQLPLADDSVTRSLPRATDAGEEPVEGWRGMLQAIWDEIRQLVVIQRTDDPPTELLAPEERYFLYQNLRIELANARSAVLQRDGRNLEASIELIQDWLERYFNTDAEAVANIQDSLAQMATVELAPELPDISGSMESVRAWQRQRAEANGSGE